MNSEIRDIALAPSGHKKIEWVRRNMPLLRGLEEEFTKEKHIAHVLEQDCNIIIDDGGDLVNMLHTRFPEKIAHVIGGCEETTTGILRLIAMDKAGELQFPMVLVNNADCKHFFDNRYGTGQSVMDGIMRTTNLIIAGKVVVVAGYGWCGKGVSMRAKGMGARVIVTEVDPVKGIEAVMDGFEVMPMKEAAKYGDLFVTVTGCSGVIDEEDFAQMKDGAILCNAGHFDVEVDVAKLGQIALKKEEQRKNIMGYLLPGDRWVYVLGEGRLVNLACGDGHPAEIMDMSFAIQALSAKYLAEHAGELTEKLIVVPREIDMEVARRKLAYLGKSIDVLTPEQEKFLIGKQYSVEHRKPGGNGNNQHTAAAKKTAPEELCQFDTIPPTATEASVRKQIAERNNVSESYVARSEKFMRGVEIMEQMMPGTKEKILSGQFKVRDADMHRLARADFPNRKQIVHEILHPEDRPAPQSSYSHYSGINYSALEVAVRRIQQDFDFLMRYLPKLPDDSYAKTETLKILKQHKAYMAQFEEMLNDKEIA